MAAVYNGEQQRPDFATTGISERSSRSVPFRIAHASPGRVRFQIPRIARDPHYVRRLIRLAESSVHVRSVRVSIAATSVIVSYHPGAMMHAAMQTHFAGIIEAARDVALPDTASDQSSKSQHGSWQRLRLPALASGIAVLGSIGFPIPAIVVAGTVAVAATPIGKRAFQSLAVEHRLNIDVLDALALALTALQGSFLAPAITVGLVELGETIRERTARASQREALDLVASVRQFVWIEREGMKERVAVEQLRRGDTVHAYPGDMISVDGRVLEGTALVDEQHLTGESVHVLREPEQRVFASTLVRDGQLSIYAEQVGADTRASQILRIMQDAPVHDTRIENYAAKVADRAVLPTLLLAGAVLALTRDSSRAASILITDFATGVRVSVPTAILSAMTAATRRGVLIRSGRAVEQLGNIDTVVFDKTGTVTLGQPAVTQVICLNPASSETEVAGLAAAAEQRLAHPAAEAVVRYAKEREITALACEEWHYRIGLGVHALIEGKAVLVGSGRFLRGEGVNIEDVRQQHGFLSEEKQSIMYVASDGVVQGAILYSDSLRPESRAVIDALRAFGMEIHLLTGDDHRIANSVARQLGIPATNTHSEAYPEQKAAVVSALRAKGKRVAFVGDGINDSPALAFADVSVSFGGGSDVAREAADVVLMENDLRGLLTAISTARQTMHLIRQNIAIVVGPNAAALAAAVFFRLGPVMATVINHGSMVIAGLNGLRPLLQDGFRDSRYQPEGTNNG